MKAMLLTAAAVSALIAGAPAMAQDSGSSVGIDLHYGNNIDTSVVTDVTYTKDVALEGTVTLEGVVEVDSSAVAVTDVKQIMGPNEVTYREENELNGENGYVDPVFGPGISEGGMDPNDDLIDGVPEGQIRAGYFAPIINTVEAFDVSGAGNIGVNLAAGYYNMQMNAATLASSAVTDPEATGGWAEASTTMLQALTGTAQYAVPSELLPEDEVEVGGGGNNFRDRNTLLGGSIAGDGNIGVNAAAGSFNQQANLMTLAVATDSALAEANSGLIQTSLFNFVEQQDSINHVGAATIADASGNIGLNMAAGVGNQQLNSLTIAASQGGAPVTPPPGGGGGGGDGS
ncbi:MAG: hypothetical protein FP826_05815 [Sphingomonadales bacterium]|nr:hypothetical protein [Sphingomonadales bacterium]MBU3993669.1 hypothetical protein [Alphaproteobacteria bacterium]